jgi:hypothetical protein
MNDTPPATPPPLPVATSNNWCQHLARASWLASIVGLLAIFVGSVMGAVHGNYSYTAVVIALVAFVCGIILGVVALLGLARYGKRKILWPAIIGICLNVPLVVFGLIQVLFVATSHIQARLEPAVHSSSARLLKDDRLQFSIDIPEGFQEFPEGKQQPNDEYSFIHRSDDKKTAFVFVIQSQNHLISRGINREQLGADFKGEIVHPNWRGVNIDATIETTMAGGFTTITYDILIPLRPGGIRLVVVESGPEAKRNEVESLADKLLASLAGETNW